MCLCISPGCPRPQNYENSLFCQACGSELLLEGKYRVIRKMGEGGFGKTFEVSHSNTFKVLKVLILDDVKAVSLFQQEARVLSQLNHSGIPKAYGYFTFFPKNSHSPLHCLVMEKINGLDLQQYLEQRSNRPIDENLAILWLTQLVNILHEVHQQNFFHRDIKPSNIMLKADGHLALIDFGTARQITKTYHQKAAGQNVTGIISPGYTPPEQLNGKAVPQSDFFALGRTFIYLLTGKSPDIFPEDPRTGKLIWRDTAPKVSKQVSGLIDYLMEPFPGKRPQNAKTVLECISEIKSTLQPHSASASPSVPSTLVQSPSNSKKAQSFGTTPINSSKTETNIFSNKIAQFIGAVIGGIILILVKFGGRELIKNFNSQPSQPVATSTPTEIQTGNYDISGNSPERIDTGITSQPPPIYTEEEPQKIPFGWNKMQGGGAELWLPESWERVDISQKLDDILKRARGKAPELEQFAELFKQNPSAFSIWAFDSNTANSRFRTHVLVVNEQVELNTNLETYLKQTSEGLQIIDIKVGLAQGYQVGRLIAIGTNSKQLYYVFKDNTTIWTVIFSTSLDEFEQRLPMFEASFRTFSVVR